MRAPLHALVCLLLPLLVLTPSLAVEARLARHPAPSPDGSEIAFSWQGDLWIVSGAGGEARRLTAHPAPDRFPVWSADGSMLAFASWRFGNADVFVLAVDGSSPPRRLTFASTDDIPEDFTPDGRAVLFSSRRDLTIRRMPALYTVPVDGGTPSLDQDALGSAAAYSPDGTRLAFVRGGTYWWRRGYRGAANRDLWLREGDGSLRPLTTFEGDDDTPRWVDESHLVFLSSRPGRKNLFLLDIDSGATRQLTHYDSSAVRFPRISADGQIVAYEIEDRIELLRTADGEIRRLPIDAPPDWTAPRLVRHSESAGAEELTVSPDGKLAAFVLHGEVFLTEVRGKDEQKIAPPRTRQLTKTAGREEDLIFMPDGGSLLLTGVRSGSRDILRLSPADEEAGWFDSLDLDEQVVVGTQADEHGARPSPDGGRLAYLRGKGDLVVRELDGGDETVLRRHWSPASFRWSPDGRWLAYAAVDEEYNSEIWIQPAAGGEAFNVSRHPDDDLSPSWSPDGRRLVWLSKRHADTLDVWGVWLARADAERSAQGWFALWQEKKGKKKKAPPAEADAKRERGKKKRKAKPEGVSAGDDGQSAGDEAAPEVRIDFEDLWRRAEPLTRLDGDEGSPLVADGGKRLVFVAEIQGKRELFSADWRGRDIKRLTQGGRRPAALSLSKDGKTVFYLDGKGTIRRTTLAGKDGDPIPFSARYVVDRQAERSAIIDEAWGALEQWFYDPQFHGVDWRAQYRKYRPWAMAASDPADFADVMNLMLGELNASHMGYRPARSGGERTGWIGASFDPAAGGPGLLISEVLPDSPAAREDVAIAAGDRLLAVDGVELTAETNVFQPFADTVGRRIPLRVLSAAGEERRVVVEPIGFRAQRQLRYRAWTRQRQELVERLSGGRLGYLHIQGMSMPSFEEFERDLYAAAHGREGLLIDVRSNGGGWTTDYLMAVLNVRRHAYTVPRDADPDVRAYPQSRLPLAAWTRPAAALCDEESYSNAEIFSRAFKNLGRGPLIGTRTFGAVISTSGRRMLNGDWVRLPLRGWYDAVTGENQENHGVVPDVSVPRPPREDLSAAQDTQLAEAVRVLLERLESDPRRGAW